MVLNMTDWDKVRIKMSYHGNRHQIMLMKIRDEFANLIDDALKRDDIDEKTRHKIFMVSTQIAKAINELYNLLE
jgi:hypothetical protein